VKSGVPQGSVLGPLLFLIMMLDITNNIKHSKLSSFADDTRLWMRVKCILDTKKLQEDLQTLYEWSDLNNKSFNSDKFEGQSYGQDEEQHYTAPDHTTIAQNNVLKDLGVFYGRGHEVQAAHQEGSSKRTTDE
jgi:ribonuclease P/MRP protein subunit RPP40